MGEYTSQWVMHRLFQCIIGKNREGKGEWRKDSIQGGVGGPQPLEPPTGGKVWQKPLRGAPAILGNPWLVPTLAAGQTAAVRTGLACHAGPTKPPYDPGAQQTYEGLVPRSRTTRRLAAVTRTAPPTAATNTATAVADPPHRGLQLLVGDGGPAGQGCAEF